jgi:hypothetical protein
VHHTITARTMMVNTTTKLFQTVGNSNVMITKKVGKLRCGILQKNGEKLIVTLENVTLIPESWINMFSIGKALKNGFNLRNMAKLFSCQREM